jgi:hypothetical protein
MCQLKKILTSSKIIIKYWAPDWEWMSSHRSGYHAALLQQNHEHVRQAEPVVLLSEPFFYVSILFERKNNKMPLISLVPN